MLIDRIDLAIDGGSFTIVLGPNGAGKSTLLRILSGELAPSQGEVRLDGRPLRSVAPWRLAHSRAVMPQASDLSFPFTVFEVASLGVEGIGRGLSRRDRQRLHSTRWSRPTSPISSTATTRRCRAASASGSISPACWRSCRPGRTVETQQVLFLDEPIASLDLKHQLALLQTAKSLARDGLAVVAVLHDLQLAAGVGDDLVLMNGGRLVARGRPDAVLTPAMLTEVFGVSLIAPALPPSPWALSPAGLHPAAVESL